MTTQDTVNEFLDLLREESTKLCNLLEFHKENDGSEKTPFILQELIDDYLSKFQKLRASQFAENIIKPNLTHSISDPTELLIASVQDELSIGASEVKGTKPSGHISWHEYFMSVAQLAARRSKDPATQVGACIVNEQNKIVATGYNGMPNGVHDNEVPWSKEGPYLETKYAYVVHAELNAILNCVLTDQKGCRVYVSLFPCNECAKAIIQSGIRHVIFLSDKHKDRDSTKAAKVMFKMAGVRCDQYSSLEA